MPGPLGNTNRANGKRFANALKAVLDEYEDDRVKRGEALRALARDMIKDALGGDAGARRDLIDRVDGKPGQAVTVDGDGEGGPVKTVTEIVIRAVDP